MLERYNWGDYVYSHVLDAAKKVHADMIIKGRPTSLRGCHYFLQVYCTTRAMASKFHQSSLKYSCTSMCTFTAIRPNKSYVLEKKYNCLIYKRTTNSHQVRFGFVLEHVEQLLSEIQQDRFIQIWTQKIVSLGRMDGDQCTHVQGYVTTDFRL